LFDCTISIIDEQTRDRLSSLLYEKRRGEIGDLTAKSTVEDSEDEEVIGYRSIAAGFPPASSDRHKWWLDQGMDQEDSLLWNQNCLTETRFPC
jgi:hypothetical protein